MDENPKRNSEPKSNSTVLFALIVVAALAVSLFLILNQQKKTLDFSDFKKLLEITTYDESHEKLVTGLTDDGILTIKESGTNGRQLEYKEPNKMVVGPNTIRGYLKYRVVPGTNPENATDGKFEVRERQNSPGLCPGRVRSREMCF